MNVSEPYIRRPVMTILVMMAVLIAGLLAYSQLPVSDLPNVDYPSINVKVLFPGASPEFMAKSVATPLEKEFMTIPGITHVSSSNTLGSSSIVLQFDIAKNIDSAAQDVEAAISRAKGRLPADLPNDPVYKKVNPSSTPILYLALTSDTLSLADLYTYADLFIAQRLSMINGVAQVLTYGSPYAVRIQVNPNSLASWGITLQEVASVLRQSNPHLPTGTLTGPFQAASVITKGQLERGEAYHSLIVAYRQQAPIRIRDLGKAFDSLQNEKYEMRYMDEQRNWPTVLLAVQRQPGANTVQVAEDIHRFLPQLAEQLPASVQLLTIFDKSQSIRDSLAEVKWTLFIAFGLVIGVVFISLGKIVDTWIPSLVLPLSIVGTCAFMYLLGYTIDNLSLLALILAIGFIIDDAIVVLENIVRRVEEGENPWTAAIQGSKQISFTILSMTLSLIAVFIPMVFMGGLIGKIFREFAVTLVIITFISGAISLTLTPMLCSRLIKGQKQGKMERFALGINRAMLALYRPILKWMLKHRWLPLLMGAASLAASLYFFYSLPKDFIPDDDIGFIVAYTQSQEGTSADRMMAYQNQVAAIIRGDPNVQSLVSIAAYPQYRTGMLFLHLKPRHERASVQEIMQGIYAKLLFVPGINTFLKNVPLIDLSIGSQSKGSYQYTLQSMDKGALYDATEKLVQRMQEWPEFQAVTSDLEIRTPQLQIEVLRDQASSLGISADEIESALQLAYAGGAVSRIATERDQYDVILELQPEFRAHPAALASIYVRSQFNGRLVPLSAVARWKTVLGPSSINHVGQFPATTISFSLTSDVPLETALKHLNEAAKEVLPATVMGTVKGAAQTFEESMQSSAFLLLMAILAIYIVLGILYESFIHPLIILSTLPPATLGGLLTLKLLAFPLSLYAYLGLILLIGIVKKNGIMLVDYALEHERTLGQSPREAIYNACLVRFRPIMMTTWTAVMGALPIALAVGPGAESRKPLGWVIIGGLLFSQLITLFVTPAIYLYLGNLSRFFSFANLERKNQAQALK